MKYKKILIILLIVMCVVIFSLCCYYLLNDFNQVMVSNEFTEKLIEKTIEINEETQKKIIDWNYLKTVNEDIIAWIEIEGTNINYPVLKDNGTYYLKHSFNKQYNSNGAIFTTNTLPFEDKETVIYGHNMKNGTMFSKLSKYLQKDFFNTYNIIKIYTPTGDYEGKIFSAYSISVDDENENIKNLDFNEKAEYYKNSSKYKIENIDNIDKIVKLTTCSYINAIYSPTEQRYYIIAKLIPNV